MAADAGNYGVVDEIDRISGTGVFGLAVVVVIGNAGVRIESHIFENTAEAKRVPDLRLVFLRELDALGVASAFEVEDAAGAPAVLVVADQVAGGIGGERGLAGSREAEKQCAHAIMPDIGRAVHGEDVALGQKKIHDAED